MIKREKNLQKLFITLQIVSNIILIMNIIGVEIDPYAKMNFYISQIIFLLLALI